MTSDMPVARAEQGSRPIRSRVREQPIGAAGLRLQRPARVRGRFARRPVVRLCSRSYAFRLAKPELRRRPSVAPYPLTLESECNAPPALTRLHGRPDKRLSSVDCHEEWLSFLDDVRRELRRVAGADVLHSVDRFGRDHQALAGADRRRWLAVDVVLQRSFQDVDDLFTRMLVPKGGASGLISTRFWMTWRPGRLRSCSWISVRFSPCACGAVVLM